MKFLDIPFGQAWAYCFTLTGYILPLAIVLVIGAIVGYFMSKSVKATGWDTKHTVISFLFLIAFLVALIGAPASIAANTSVEQAARGVFIR